MKTTAIVQCVQRTQYGRLEIRLRTNAAEEHTITVQHTRTAARTYTVGREVEITTKAK